MVEGRPKHADTVLRLGLMWSEANPSFPEASPDLVEANIRYGPNAVQVEPNTTLAPSQPNYAARAADRVRMFVHTFAILAPELGNIAELNQVRKTGKQNTSSL